MRCISRATMSDAEFAALSAHYDEAQIFEIILLCGFYRTVSYLANGLRFAAGGKGGAVSEGGSSRHSKS